VLVKCSPPHELIAAYKEFKERGAQCLSVETGLSASAYCFGERVLLVYEESETGLVALTHPSAWKRNSANFAFTEFSEDEMRRPTPHTQYP
jgi:hypothetical protein